MVQDILALERTGFAKYLTGSMRLGIPLNLIGTTPIYRKAPTKRIQRSLSEDTAKLERRILFRKTALSPKMSARYGGSANKKANDRVPHNLLNLKFEFQSINPYKKLAYACRTCVRQAAKPGMPFTTK